MTTASMVITCALPGCAETFKRRPGPGRPRKYHSDTCAKEAKRQAKERDRATLTNTLNLEAEEREPEGKHVKPKRSEEPGTDKFRVGASGNWDSIEGEGGKLHPGIAESCMRATGWHPGWKTPPMEARYRCETTVQAIEDAKAQPALGEEEREKLKRRWEKQHETKFTRLIEKSAQRVRKAETLPVKPIVLGDPEGPWNTPQPARKGTTRQGPPARRDHPFEEDHFPGELALKRIGLREGCKLRRPDTHHLCPLCDPYLVDRDPAEAFFPIEVRPELTYKLAEDLVPAEKAARWATKHLRLYEPERNGGTFWRDAPQPPQSRTAKGKSAKWVRARWPVAAKMLELGEELPAEREWREWLARPRPVPATPKLNPPVPRGRVKPVLPRWPAEKEERWDPSTPRCECGWIIVPKIPKTPKPAAICRRCEGPPSARELKVVKLKAHVVEARAPVEESDSETEVAA